MVTMNIELKNIKYYESFSEETLAFNANLYIEGKRAGIAKNDGGGGATYCVGDNKEGQELIRQAENYTKTLPDKLYPKDEYMEAFSIPMNLEYYINDLLNNCLQKKTSKKFRRRSLRIWKKGIWRKVF
jgi:3-hydroxy-3-methylglutaryl CoA synthase